MIVSVRMMILNRKKRKTLVRCTRQFVLLEVKIHKMKNFLRNLFRLWLYSLVNQYFFVVLPTHYTSHLDIKYTRENVNFHSWRKFYVLFVYMVFGFYVYADRLVWFASFYSFPRVILFVLCVVFPKEGTGWMGIEMKMMMGLT